VPRELDGSSDDEVNELSGSVLADINWAILAQVYEGNRVS
jgi:hypothetical protein